jgi:ABC-type sugar transport system substrate-binding protein
MRLAKGSVTTWQLFVVGLLMIGVGLAVGCSGSKEGGAAKKYKLAFVTNNASDFWTIARKGTEKAATELPNVEVEFRINSDGTAAEQQRVVDDLLAKASKASPSVRSIRPINRR